MKFLSTPTFVDVSKALPSQMLLSVSEPSIGGAHCTLSISEVTSRLREADTA